MKLFAIFLFVMIFWANAFSQIYYLGQSKETILESLRSAEGYGFEVYFYEKDLDVNNLSPMSVEVKSDSLNLEFEFLFDKKHNFCVAVITKYHCGECVEKNVNDLLADKKLKWKSIGKNEYLSKKILKKVKTTDANNKKVKAVASPHMKMVKDLSGEFCAFVRLSLPFYTPEDWKALTE